MLPNCPLGDAANQSNSVAILSFCYRNQVVVKKPENLPLLNMKCIKLFDL